MLQFKQMRLLMCRRWHVYLTCSSQYTIFTLPAANVSRHHPVVQQKCFMSKKLPDEMLLSDTRVTRYVTSLMKKHENATEKLMRPDEGHGSIAAANQTVHELNGIVELYTKYTQNLADLKDLNDAVKHEGDSELQIMLKDEIDQLQDESVVLESQVLEQLMPAETADNSDVMLEINAGVGGQEAMLFAGEVLSMYMSYAEYRGWNVEIVSSTDTDTGGILKAVLLIMGDEVFRHLKYESGVHRVQRIPRTEQKGRVHTSTITVAVLPKPREVDIEINPKDLKFQYFHSSGPGGQSVNTSDSAVRCIHIPTGHVTECQTERLQMKNRAKAIDMMRTKLYDEELTRQQSQMQTRRRLQVGSAARSEKVRTYNYPQDRITDHRVGYNVYNVPSFMQGAAALSEMLDTLMDISKTEALREVIEQYCMESDDSKNR